jgi:hypothetical protein
MLPNIHCYVKILSSDELSLLYAVKWRALFVVTSSPCRGELSGWAFLARCYLVMSSPCKAASSSWLGILESLLQLVDYPLHHQHVNLQSSENILLQDCWILFCLFGFSVNASKLNRICHSQTWACWTYPWPCSSTRLTLLLECWCQAEVVDLLWKWRWLAYVFPSFRHFHQQHPWGMDTCTVQSVFLSTTSREDV